MTLEAKVQVHLRVKRKSDSGIGYSRYAVELPGSATVLDALIHVREYVDGTLGLRCSCRSAICGSCSMRIDGQARLACKTKAITLTHGDESHEIRVEPMTNMPVIRDLIVDQEPFWRKVRQVEPYLQPSEPPPQHEYLVPAGAMADISAHAMRCIMCGACVSDCTVLEVDENFIAPAALAKAYRFVADPRDGQTDARLRKLSEYSGIWDCTRCNMCVEVCPKNVAPMDRIMQLRDLAGEAGVRNNAGTRHGAAFTRSVVDGGRLNEVWLLPQSVGMLNVRRLTEELPGALRMFRAGKLPPAQYIPPGAPGSHRIPGIERVRRLVRRSQELKPAKPAIAPR